MKGSPIATVCRRECGWLRRHPQHGLFLLVFPWIVAAVTLLIFREGILQRLPLAVVDKDQSRQSRQYVRMLSSVPALEVTAVAELEAAWRDLGAGRVYGVVYLPENFSRRLKRGERPEVTAYVNQQYLLAGNLLQKELQTVAMTYAAGVELSLYLRSGAAPRQAKAAISPVSVQRSTLFNAYLNYQPFLTVGLIMALIQLAAMFSGVFAVGRELKAGSSAAWLEAAGGRRTAALLGKLLPYFVSVSLCLLATIAVLHGYLDWRVSRGLWIYLAGGLLMIASGHLLGALTTLLFRGARAGASVASLLGAPAFAFAGVSFPLASMPSVAVWWAHLLPSTYYLKLQTAVTVRGTGAFPALDAFCGLLIYLVLMIAAVWAVLLPRLRRIRPSDCF